MVHIQKLEVRGYRALTELSVEGLGRVNLITGANNSGKSSLLEVLRILASAGSPGVIREVLDQREERLHHASSNAGASSIQEFIPFTSLFSGRPGVPHSDDQIEIAGIGRNDERYLRLEVLWFLESVDLTGGKNYTRLVSAYAHEEGMVPVLRASGRHGVLASYDSKLNLLRDLGDVGFGVEAQTNRLNFSSIPSLAFQRTSELGAMWDRSFVLGLDSRVIEIMKVIQPDIESLGMVNAESTNQRFAMVRANGCPKPLPLRSFGDGLNRLFGIALSLVSAKDGLLLIDEFENGLHHTVQTDIWRAIFRMARDLSVQVFATSHSWDAIEAFQTAASESPEDGVLVRLTRRDGKLFTTVFDEDDLETVTRENIEVR